MKKVLMMTQAEFLTRSDHDENKIFDEMQPIDFNSSQAIKSLLCGAQIVDVELCDEPFTDGITLYLDYPDGHGAVLSIDVPDEVIFRAANDIDDPDTEDHFLDARYIHVEYEDGR
jgi:hypothetical protein